jgi:Na+/melibiose symporter-like transporter
MDLFLSIVLIANLIAVMVLMYNIEEIGDYSVREDGVKIKHVAFVILFLPAVLLLGFAIVMTAIVVYSLDSKWFEKVMNALNKRIY